MEWRVLGRFEAVGDDGQVMDAGWPRPQALPAPARAAGHPAPAGQLPDQVRHGEESAGPSRLRVRIPRMRRVRGDGRVLDQAGCCARGINASFLDAVRFARPAGDGHAALHRNDAAAARLPRQAPGLRRGR
jgi:hypothetical protein